MSKYKAFVIMPFGSDFNDVYKLGIKATAKECDVVPSFLYPVVSAFARLFVITSIRFISLTMPV